MTTEYVPLACGLHSELELMAMGRARVVLVAEEGKYQGQVMDVRTEGQAEYLVLLDDLGDQHKFRLDRLRHIEQLENGRHWRR